MKENYAILINRALALPEMIKMTKKLELNSPNWSQCTVKYVCLRCKTDCFVKYFDKASSLKG